MKQRYSHSQSSRKLRYLRFFPYSCEKTQALTNTCLPCPSLFCSALNHSNADFSLLSLIKEQLCWWLMASLSRPLPWPLTVQGRSPYPRPWCSISDMHDTCWSRESELILINIRPASAYSSLPILLPLQGHICQQQESCLLFLLELFCWYLGLSIAHGDSSKPIFLVVFYFNCSSLNLGLICESIVDGSLTTEW